MAVRSSKNGNFVNIHNDSGLPLFEPWQGLTQNNFGFLRFYYELAIESGCLVLSYSHSSSVLTIQLDLNTFNFNLNFQDRSKTVYKPKSTIYQVFLCTTSYN